MPAIVPGAAWSVVGMRILDDRSIHVAFRDGVEGIVRFGDGFFRGVFAHLTNARRFSEARVEMGAVTWPDGLDVAPDRMHDDILRDGECLIH